MNNAQQMSGKITTLLKEKKVSARQMLIELGMGLETISKMKKGQMPHTDKIYRIAEFLGVSTDYLFGQTEIMSTNGVLSRIGSAIAATPQRVGSLSGGSVVSNEILLKISEYLGCSMFYLTGGNDFPKNINKRKPKDLDKNTLIEILDIMDCCAENNAYRTLQVQISYLIIENLNRKGFTRDDIYKNCKLDGAKLDFLYNREENFDKPRNYGFNFSDLMRIRRYTGLTVEYLLTGIEGA
jgi:DNA-binding Xre family transcriptional regulator